MCFAELDDLKVKLDALRPLSADILANIREETILQWTYNSNAIEGNTLTLKETKVVLEGITVGGKTLREHFEAINHREAIFLVEDIVKNQIPFSDFTVKSIHKLILRNIDDENAGVFRKRNVIISGAKHTPPDFVFVQEEMARLINKYNDEWQKLHAVERAALLHCEFVKIHPFTDGNGRTARLLMNLELLKNGFPAAVLPLSRRLEYYEALDTAHTDDDFARFLTLICEIVKESFSIYRKVLP
jgi:Fic family protein